jgi:hypothetical protein
MFEVNESTGGRCGTNGTMVDVSVCTQHTGTTYNSVEGVACCITQEVLCVQ